MSPDFPKLLARVGVPPVLPLETGTTPPAADLSPHAAEVVAARFDTVVAAAEGCDGVVAISVTRAGVWR